MSKGKLIAGFFILLFFLHQDFWWKNDATLVLGFLPVSLAYHTVWTLLVALGWFLVGRFCWPKGLDEAAVSPSTAASRPSEDRRSR